MYVCSFDWKTRLVKLILFAVLLLLFLNGACANEEGSLGYKLAKMLQSKGI